MSNSRICRYYLQGNCSYGSSCRFSHSNNRHHDEYQPKTIRNGRSQYQDNDNWNNNHESYRSSDQYEQNNYGHENERNKYQDNRNWNNKHNNCESYKSSDQYKQNKYQHGNVRNLYHDDESWNNNYNNRENFRSSDRYEQNKYQHGNVRNLYHDDERWNNKHNNRENSRNSDQYEQTNYQHHTNNVKNDYKKYNSYENKNRYQSYNNKNYNDYNEYENKNRHQSHKDYNTNNYLKEYNKGNNFKSNYNYSNTKYNDDYHQSKYDNDIDNFSFNIKDDTCLNSRTNSDDQLHNKYKYENGNICLSERNKMVQYYDKEIKSYQTHIIQMIKNKCWPFTCFNPIGYNHPIQSVGSLNLIEISFEEIRCDYYGIKNVCADPDLIHKQVFSELLSKANQQKEDIISLTDKNVDDMLITFEKCEKLKTNPDLKDSIQADENSYWNMSLKRLKTPIENKNFELFSFKITDEDTNIIDTNTIDTNTIDTNTIDEAPKILMQTEVYGKTDKGFDQENFTDYIPIMPPPKMYCL